MKWARIRLAVAALLFVAWLGWLFYLAAFSNARPPVILSRLQLDNSNFDVIASVAQTDNQPPKVTIEDVHWPQTRAAEKLLHTTISVPDLLSCEGWKGPGRYILPLVTNWKGSYEVAPLPRTPGFEGAKPRIYVENADTLKQLNSITKPDVFALPSQ
ncbi:MAG TPA: hypothetical protein VK395_34245 [Gemmataceae bacterium]|nr:hypothetical protein [Gemmataceae bacterium]